MANCSIPGQLCDDRALKPSGSVLEVCYFEIDNPNIETVLRLDLFCFTNRSTRVVQNRFSQNMLKTTKVKDHFDKMAPAYDHLSDRFPWRWLRQREAQTILSLLGNIVGKEILEFGCGTGYYSKLLLDAGADQLWVVDLSQAMLDQLSAPRITKICGDVSSVELSRLFPVSVSAGLFEFVEDCPKVLGNIAKHTDADGSIVILYPLKGFLGSLYRWTHKLNGLEIRVFTVREFQALAEDAGLQIVETQKCGLFSAVSTFRRLA